MQRSAGDNDRNGKTDNTILNMAAKEKITNIGNIEKFLIKLENNTEMLAESFEAGNCGEAVNDRFKRVLDTFQEFVTTNCEELNYEADEIRRELVDLRESKEVLSAMIEELESESIIVFRAETGEELMWVEEIRKQFCERFARKGNTDEIKSY